MSVNDLPALIVEEILLYLTSRDIACAVLAIPHWREIIDTKTFMTRHRRRFWELAHHPVVDALLYIYRDDKVPGYCCSMQKCHTISNHCMACLLDPRLLLSQSGDDTCLCIDHLFIHGNTNDIIWTTPWNPNTKHVWPLCWRYFGTEPSRSIHMLLNGFK